MGAIRGFMGCAASLGACHTGCGGHGVYINRASMGVLPAKGTIIKGASGMESILTG